MKILVAYATRYESTAAVAKRIGETFRASGADVDVREAHEVESLDGIDAVVLGTPVYHGKPLVGATAFAKRLTCELSEMPTAFFIVGLGLAHPNEKFIRKVVKATKDIITTLHPRDVGLFGGALDYANVGRFMRWMMKLMKIREGDFRNWDVIARWADDVFGVLTGSDGTADTSEDNG